MSNKCKSWVWLYAKRYDDKAYCDLCTEHENSAISYIGGTTGSLARHLRTIHNLNLPRTVTRRVVSGDEFDNPDILTSSTTTASSSESESLEIDAPIPRKRRRNFINREDDKICNSEKTEQIHQALTKMIAVNQMPISFGSIEGFKQFMTVVEPNYKICNEEAIKSRMKR